MATENHPFSSSPYSTIVGGTTLPYKLNIRGKDSVNPVETAWGDIVSMSPKLIAIGAFNAGGGGFSALNPTPQYQQGVSGVNTFRAIELLKYQGGKFTVQSNPKVITGTGNSRNIPDVAANSDIRTGYAVYASGDQLSVSKGKLVRKPVKQWVMSGGTSFATPQIAAANAVMNSGLSQPIGFWNPQIYQFAQQPNTPFHVLDSANSNNLYYTGQPGKLYNQASGLGTINFDLLMSRFKAGR